MRRLLAPATDGRDGPGDARAPRLARRSARPRPFARPIRTPEPPRLVKPDSPRLIDGVIDYFGGAGGTGGRQAVDEPVRLAAIEGTRGRAHGGRLPRREPASRLDVRLPDGPGAIAGLARAVEEGGAAIAGLVVGRAGVGRRRAVVRLASIDPRPVVAALRAAGYEVLGPWADAGRSRALPVPAPT